MFCSGKGTLSKYHSYLNAWMIYVLLCVLWIWYVEWMCLPSVGFVYHQCDYDVLMCVAFIWFVNKYMKCCLIWIKRKYLNCQLRHVIINAYVKWYVIVAFAHIEWTIYAHVFHGTC
jgi:hypothetical protein